MSDSFVQGTAAGTNSASTLSATFADSVTVGNLLVVGFIGGNASFSDPPPEITIADSSSGANVYTLVDGVNGWGIGNPGNFDALYYCVAAAGGAGLEVTATGNMDVYGTLIVAEFVPPAGTISVDVFNSFYAASGTTLNAGSITLAGTELCVALFDIDSSGPTHTAGSGFTTGVDYTQGADTGEPAYLEYALGASGTINPALTLSDSTDGFGICVAFKATVSAPPSRSASALLAAS